MSDRLIPDSFPVASAQQRMSPESDPQNAGSIGLPPVSATRKRGKCMSRRAGQNPSVRTRFNRTKGVDEYFFQYWIDVPETGRA
jgi:hypothetical protein